MRFPEGHNAFDEFFHKGIVLGVGLNRKKKRRYRVPPKICLTQFWHSVPQIPSLTHKTRSGCINPFRKSSLSLTTRAIIPKDERMGVGAKPGFCESSGCKKQKLFNYQRIIECACSKIKHNQAYKWRISQCLCKKWLTRYRAISYKRRF